MAAVNSWTGLSLSWVVNSFPSPSSISFGLNKTIVITGCVSGFHFIVDSISELSVIAPVLRILCFYLFPFSSIATVHTFLQGWINPGCFVQFRTSSSKRSMWVNNAQEFCFPVWPYQIWIFWFIERPVLLRDFISTISMIKISKISVRDGRVSLRW